VADRGGRQQDRPGPPQSRPGPIPAGAVPGRAPGWAPPPPGAPGAQRYQGQPVNPAYYVPRQAPTHVPPGQLRPGAPGAPRGPMPNGAPGPRRTDATQALVTGPRPPGAPPTRQAQYPPRAPLPQDEGGRRLLVRDVATRRVVRRLDVWSVFKVSFIFYFCVLVVMIAAGVVLWNVAAAFGVITSLDKLVRSLFALKSYRLHPTAALIWGSAVGAALCLIGVLVNVIASVLYNLISDLVGGIQVVALSDRDR
jgi:Transmembrane domain of unknown function (DUF3566)